jgi:hypothetical protein
VLGKNSPTSSRKSRPRSPGASRIALAVRAGRREDLGDSNVAIPRSSMFARLSIYENVDLNLTDEVRQWMEGVETNPFRDHGVVPVFGP